MKLIAYKIDELKMFCISHMLFVAIVENTLDHTVDDSEFFVKGYCVHRLDRNRHGGGVLLFLTLTDT